MVVENEIAARSIKYLAYFMHIINLRKIKKYFIAYLYIYIYLLFMRIAIFQVSAKNYAHLLKTLSSARGILHSTHKL